MAKTSGYSHAFAALLSLLVGKLLASYLQPYFPMVFDPLEERARWAQGRLEALIGVEFSSGLFVPAAIAVLLAFVWGLLYHHIRHGRTADK